MRKNSGPVEYWLCGDQVWSLDCKKGNEYKWSEKNWMTTITFYCELDNQSCISLEVRLYRFVLLWLSHISDAREEKFEVQSQLFGGSVGGA